MSKFKEAVNQFEKIAETGQIKQNPEALIAYGTALRNINLF